MLYTGKIWIKRKLKNGLYCDNIYIQKKHNSQMKQTCYQQNHTTAVIVGSRKKNFTYFLAASMHCATAYFQGWHLISAKYVKRKTWWTDFYINMCSPSFSQWTRQGPESFRLSIIATAAALLIGGWEHSYWQCAGVTGFITEVTEKYKRRWNLSIYQKFHVLHLQDCVTITPAAFKLVKHWIVRVAP